MCVILWSLIFPYTLSEKPTHEMKRCSNSVQSVIHGILDSKRGNSPHILSLTSTVFTCSQILGRAFSYYFHHS